MSLTNKFTRWKLSYVTNLQLFRFSNSSQVFIPTIEIRGEYHLVEKSHRLSEQPVFPTVNRLPLNNDRLCTVKIINNMSCDS